MKIRITTKILVGFGLVVALTVVVGWYGLWKLAQVRDRTIRIADRDLQALELLRRVAHTQNQMRQMQERVLAQYLLHKEGLSDRDAVSVQDLWRRGREETFALLLELEGGATEWERMTISPAREDQWRKIQRNAQQTRDSLAAVSDEVEAGFGLLSQDELNKVVARKPELDRLRESFDRLSEEGADLVQELVGLGTDAIRASHEEAQSSIIAALLLAVVLASGAGLSIQRSISRPLSDFIRFAERVGKGDLTQRAQSTNTDELGSLGKSLNEMVVGLTELTGQTRTATQNLRSASSEILASTQQQVASMTEQTAAVQETSSTMEEISESGTQVAERAKEVSAAAEATSSHTQSGLTAVQAMTRAMDSIREQAQSVAENIVSLSEKTQVVEEIIATVNDIAERSHLLALNASIEAAAAGESGRSFSVVAQEMKNLADQAKDATVQVRAILGEIQKGINTSVMLTEEALKRVESGKDQADVAEKNIQQLGTSIQESVKAFQQIVAATNQQQIGFDQVAQALKNITQSIDQAASGNRQLEGAAANLSALSQQLEQAIQRYTI